LRREDGQNHQNKCVFIFLNHTNHRDNQYNIFKVFNQNVQYPHAIIITR
jgi:hypothetical protein